MNTQRLITVFLDFQVKGDVEHQVPAGYKIVQVVSSAVDNANHTSGSMKMPRLAITILCEKIE